MAKASKTRRWWGWWLAAAAVIAGAGWWLTHEARTPPPPATRVPAEVADAEALAALADWHALPVFGDRLYTQQSSHDRGGGGPVENPLWARGNRDMNNFLCASADARSAEARARMRLDTPRCPEAQVHGFVMARFEGSGRLARLWLTAASIRRAPADYELLRIYVDDEPHPRIELPLSRALDGSGGEIFARPFGAGTGRHLAWYYPVVFGSRLVVALDRLSPRDLYYYQVDAVLDRERRARPAAAKPLPERQRASALLLEGPRPAGERRNQQLELGPAERRTLWSLEGPATVERLEAQVRTSEIAALAALRLRVRWDGQPAPAIDLPLADIFVTRDAVPEGGSPALGAHTEGAQTTLRLTLPMPFARSADWSLENTGSVTATLAATIFLARGVPREPWGHLHTELRETRPASMPAVRRHPLVAASGRGRLVGVCLMMRGHSVVLDGRPTHPLSFLEGDELGVIDGRRAITGTGTEDYFDDAFFFEGGATATPFAQAWAIGRDEGGRGHACACRWHLLGDAIDFRRSLELSIEMGPDQPAMVDGYRSVAFLYR